MQLPITHPYGVAFTDSSEPCHAVSGRYVAISEDDRRGRNAQGQVSGNAVYHALSEKGVTRHDLLPLFGHPSRSDLVMIPGFLGFPDLALTDGPVM